MPELPEVETVARQLAPLIAGRRIERIELFDARLGRPPLRQLYGSTIGRVFRSGKEVVIEARGEPADEHGSPRSRWLSVHLRMTGRLIWRAGRARDARRHLRARFRVDGGAVLFYDPRRFGTLRLHQCAEQTAPPGLDPMSPGFSVEALGELLASSAQPLKSWLLRQDRLVGLGNIYASEILFAARLHPEKLAGSLSRRQVVRLHRATIDVLEAAIAACGTTFSDFQTAQGLTGSYQRFLAVYGRDGQPCPRCGAAVRRRVQAQRATFWCPRCQR